MDQLPEIDKKNSVQRLVDQDLCFQCGACSCICGSKAIHMREVKKRGLIYPQVDPYLCSNCGLCLQVCPMNHLKMPQRKMELEQAVACGLYTSGFQDIYEKSSSGGFVTAMIKYLFESGQITKAFVIAMDAQSVYRGRYVVVKDARQLLDTAGSKYQHVPFDHRMLDQIVPGDRAVLVGLPCHIRGMDRLIRQKPKLKNAFVLKIGLICTIGRGLNATRYMIEKHVREKRDGKLTSLEYRNGAYPGKMTLCTERSKKEVKLFDFLFHVDFLFMPKGCLFCNDLFNDLADISVGDPWGYDDGKKAMVIVRTPSVDRLLHSAVEAGYLMYHGEMGKSDAYHTQKHGHQYKIANYGKRLRLYRKVGIRCPVVQEPVKEKVTLKNTVGFLMVFFNSQFFNREIGLKTALILPGPVLRFYRKLTQRFCS